jgi:hypothetical protein
MFSKLKLNSIYYNIWMEVSCTHFCLRKNALVTWTPIYHQTLNNDHAISHHENLDHEWEMVLDLNDLLAKFDS